MAYHVAISSRPEVWANTGDVPVAVCPDPETAHRICDALNQCDELLAALKGVIAVADRDTDVFAAVRAALARGQP